MKRTPSLLILVVLSALVACPEADRSAAPGALRVYLARHGQTDWNARHRLQGGTDVPLNDTGRAQARRLAGRLRGLRLDGVFSSALSRSRETAEIVAGGTRVESLPGLNEQSLGEFEGKILDGSDPEMEETFRQRASDPDDDLGGGESESRFRARIHETLESIVRRHPDGAILIVGHGGTNQMILRDLLKLPAEKARRIRQANDELYLIELPPQTEPKLWKYISPENLDQL